MVQNIKRTMLALGVLCLLAVPAAAQEIEKPRLFSLAVVAEFVVDQIQNLVAAFGPEMEPHGTPTGDNSTATTEAATEQGLEAALADIGGGLEPHG